MVSEIPVEDGELKCHLFQQGFLPEETPSIGKYFFRLSFLFDKTIHAINTLLKVLNYYGFID